MRKLTFTLGAALALVGASPLAMAQTYYDGSDPYRYNRSIYPGYTSYVGTVVEVLPVGSRGTRIERVCRPLAANPYAYGSPVYQPPVLDQYGRPIHAGNYYGRSGYVYDRYGNRINPRYDQSHDPDRFAGKVVGALVGGALANQIGDGGGRTAATIAGTVAGAVIANQIQREQQDNRYGSSDYRYRGRHDGGYRNSGYYGNSGYYAGTYPQTYGQYGVPTQCYNATVPLGRVIGFDVRYTIDGRLYEGRYSSAPAIGSQIRMGRNDRPIY